MSHIVVSGTEANPGNTVVETVTIDDLVTKEALHPGAVKIDIEGFDILALQGALSTARAHQPVFLVEYNLEDGRPNTWEDLDNFLCDTEYVIFAVSRRPEGLFGYRYSLSQHTVSELTGLSIKMIFLVHGSAREWFGELSRKTGNWGRDALRPASVADFLGRFGID